jgi:hypothetical protein
MVVAHLRAVLLYLRALRRRLVGELSGAGSRMPAARVRVPPPSPRREDKIVRDRVSARRRTD